MKRIIAILLVVSMLFGFSGCATKADKLAAAELSEKISSIGTVKLTSEEKINDIKAQYDALSDKQKKRVENVDVLDNAVAELNKLIEEKNAKDVANVEKLIEQIGNVTADSSKQINTAKAAYDKLSDDLKKAVKNANTLEKAVSDIEAIYVAQLNTFIAVISNELKIENEAEVNEAVKKYNSLSDDAKAKVNDSKVLLDAPESIKNLKIKEVEDLIAAIGKVTADSGAAITVAEKKYNALSEVEKASVKNAKTIEEAKKQLTAAIKEKGKKLLSSFKKDADAVTGDTFYFPRTMGFYGEYWAADVRCFALPYIGVKGDSTWLRLIANYTGDDWVFFEKIIFSVDGENTTKYFSYYDVTRDNGGGDVWEYVDIPVGDYEIELLREIADSKTTIVRFQGDDYRHDFTITQADKNAIKEILLAYDSLTAE